MKINELIRKLRKEQNLTQEQVANYLGVTAPAVNKWESGASYPDITLLAPLARILKTNVDTLLSFHEELTDKEINKIISEISLEITERGYEEAFQRAASLISEYPNCDKLILFTAQVLNAYLSLQTAEGKEKYKKQIIAWFEMVAFSEQKELANMAVASLCQNYMANGDYQEAQRLLDQIPPVGFDKRIMQASLYANKEKFDEAYKIHEGMIYQNANGILGSMMQIIHLLCKQKDYDTALSYAKLCRIVANTFELGQYTAASSELMIALEMKNKEESLRLLEEMVSEVGKMNCVRESKLYRHMKFKEDNGLKEMRGMLKKSLEKDEAVDFIRREPEFLRIIRILSED